MIAAIQQADSYKQQAESTGKNEFIDIVVDSEMAVDLANLTEHQQLVINLRWTAGFTQDEVARFLGITQPAVYQAEKAAERKVQSVLYQWGMEA